MILSNNTDVTSQSDDAINVNGTLKRLPIVGVLGSGTDLHSKRSTKLGMWLATQPVHLLTGGGGGVMLSVSRAFTSNSERRGLAIGVIPGRVNEAVNEYESLEGYPNPWIEVPVFTHLPDSGCLGMGPTSRNHINVLSSDVLVILPGQLGTVSEAELAVRYNKPAIAWLDERSQIIGLHPDVPVAKRFKQVREFISSNLPG